MKRILFVCAGQEFPNGAFAFLKSMEAHEPVSVKGLFFSPIDIEGMVTASQIAVMEPYLRLKEKDRKAVKDNKLHFIKQCELNYIKHQVHENTDEWNKEILAEESRFADIVMLSGELFYSDINADQPNSFLREALHAAECPVLVIPEDYAPFEHIVIAYDGSKESMFALKQFCYLLPQFTDLPTEFIYVRDETTEEIPDLENLKCFTRLHFNSMNFSKLHFKAASYFATWIGERQHVLMVSGSFGRSPFSYITKRSFAEQVIHDHRMPLFVAHI